MPGPGWALVLQQHAFLGANQLQTGVPQSSCRDSQPLQEDRKPVGGGTYRLPGIPRLTHRQDGPSLCLLVVVLGKNIVVRDGGGVIFFLLLGGVRREKRTPRSILLQKIPGTMQNAFPLLSVSRRSLTSKLLSTGILSHQMVQDTCRHLRLQHSPGQRFGVPEPAQSPG